MVFAAADYLMQQLQPDKCLNASKCTFSMVQGIYIYATPVIISRIYIYYVLHSWHDTLTVGFIAALQKTKDFCKGTAAYILEYLYFTMFKGIKVC